MRNAIKKARFSTHFSFLNDGKEECSKKQKYCLNSYSSFKCQILEPIHLTMTIKRSIGVTTRHLSSGKFDRDDGISFQTSLGAKSYHSNISSCTTTDSSSSAGDEDDFDTPEVVQVATYDEVSLARVSSFRTCLEFNEQNSIYIISFNHRKWSNSSRRKTSKLPRVPRIPITI